MHAWRSRAGTIWFRKDPRVELHYLPLPCGKCLGCYQRNARAWALRCKLELQYHSHAVFTTNTYRDDALPPTLSKRHLQLWLKRLRKALGPARPVRYFASGEYGEKRGRPHYHAILYGVGLHDQELLEDTWQHGHVRTGHALTEGIAYVAGYTAKKNGDRLAMKHDRVDPDTGEVYQYQPPFILMSRNGGIGTGGSPRPPDPRDHFLFPARRAVTEKLKHAADAAQSKTALENWRYYAVMNGFKMPVPKYLHDQWKKHATEEEIEEVRIAKMNYALQRTHPDRDRLHAMEKIAMKKQQLDGEKRTMEK